MINAGYSPNSPIDVRCAKCNKVHQKSFKQLEYEHILKCPNCGDTAINDPQAMENLRSLRQAQEPGHLAIQFLGGWRNRRRFWSSFTDRKRSC